MAKQTDRETICRMTALAQARPELDIKNIIKDKDRLCPKCAKPIAERSGDPVLYYGEKFCGPCFKDFQMVAGDYFRASIFEK